MFNTLLTSVSEFSFEITFYALQHSFMPNEKPAPDGAALDEPWNDNRVVQADIDLGGFYNIT